MCEKPMAVNAQQVRELVDLARKKSVFLMEAVWSRFFPLHERIRAIIEKGQIGEVSY